MKGKEMVKLFTDFVNSAGLRDKQEFAEAMMLEHRTLQQEAFDLMLKTMEAWAKLPDDRIDPRNSGAVRLSKRIIESLD